MALTPLGARELAEHRHEVLVQAGAGEGSAIPDADYESQGVRIVSAAFEAAELVLKVKEPQPRLPLLTPMSEIAARSRPRRGPSSRVIRREQLGLMKPGAVLIDVAIDQGGCFETSRPTTHHEPTFEVDGITHYCVANMPGVVPISSTYALTNATLPYALDLADLGVAEAARRNPELAMGVNVAAGEVTHPAVAAGVGAEHAPVERVLGAAAG